MKTTVDSLSDIIRNKMKQLSTEQRYPNTDPDRMDENIETLTKQVKSLIKIRNDFELLMTDVIL